MVNSVYRVTHKHLLAFARELGYDVYGAPGSSIVGETMPGGGYRSVHGPASTAENMAYLRGVRDARGVDGKVVNASVGALYRALTEDIAKQLTCDEAEAVASLYHLVGRHADAADIILYHSVSDEEADDEHHDLYLLAHK